MSPFFVALLLLALVLGVLELDKRRVFPRLFHYLPSPFWCYFIPMLLSTAGILPEKSPIYSFLTTYVLSGCLILLLLNVNVPSILRLGPTALGALAVGVFGIALGASSSYALFAHWLPAETWKGIGALSASWTGGSANMLAVKEGLQTPDAVFAPMVIVDTVMTYTWMGIMIALAAFQERWDRWVKADRSTLEDAVSRLAHDAGRGVRTTPEYMRGTGLLNKKQGRARNAGEGTLHKENLLPNPESRTPHSMHALWLIGLSVLIGAFCLHLAEYLPTWGGVMNRSGWAFLMVTAIGILLSFTPASQLERFGASRWGYACLYLLLAAMGSKARLQSILETPVLLVMAILWVSVHALVLASYGYLRRVPMFFLAAASQANIGGTASAPIVAGVYQPRLASVGLLLAIAVNVVGTYIGFAIAHLCRWIHP